MSTPPFILAAIPDHLLFVNDRAPKARTARARALALWLQDNRCRPTFAELENERRRRQSTPSTTPEGEIHDQPHR